MREREREILFLLKIHFAERMNGDTMRRRREGE
jgi:hypothetical protein